jgi:hypothetical protein
MRLLPFLLLASACASGSAREADLSGELAGRHPGAPRDCVGTSSATNLTARDSRSLVYSQAGTIWVNRLEAACPGLGPASTLIVDVHGSQYCRGDHFRTLELGRIIPGPTCRLGAFTPWRR